jgi:hypothetical protein
MTPTEGARVIFKGGLGRQPHEDPNEEHEGIVNGPTQLLTDRAYVPVHVSSENHNLLVISTNIVRVLP